MGKPMFHWRPKGSGLGGDRRARERARVARPVLFERLDEPGRLQRGETRDLGAGGARIVTRQPLPPGAIINVELPPEGWEARHEETQVVEGRVVRTAPDESGATAMGVAFRQASPAPNLMRVPIAPTPRPSHQLFLELPPARSRTRTPKAAPAPWRKAAALMLATFLLFLFGLWSASRLVPLLQQAGPAHAGVLAATTDEIPLDAAEPAAAVSIAALPENLQPLADVVDDESSASHGIASIEALTELASPVALLTQAEAALAAGASDDAAEQFARVSANAGVAPVERFRAKLGQAHAAARLQHRGRALHFARDAQTIAGVPPVWQQVAAALEAALHKNLRASSLPSFEEWDTLVPFDTAADVASRGVGERAPDAPPAAPAGHSVSDDPSEHADADDAPLRLEVDRSDYVLRVLRDGAVVAELPVGLGRDGRTPLGSFVIANKLRDPDWYDRGRSVPHGDPANPLGSRWMGLGHDGRATSYGLHATDNPADLGAPVSRGCVRLRPSDAEALYRLCPVGTPVDVVE